MKKTVLTVHGINTDGRWQRDIEPILRPFFEPISIRYRHYRWFGAIKLLLEPWVLFIAGSIPLVLWWLGQLTGSRFLVVETTALLSGLVLAVVAATIRRRLALRSFMRQASQHVQDRHPHVIAHSLGSYLTATALQEYAPARADRIVVVGCVLDPSWDWIALHKRKRNVFTEVRNDWSTHDPVPMLARLLRWRIRGFGNAGREGFRGDANLIHDVADPSQECGSCNAKSNRSALIHNVDCSAYGHSSAFLGPAHAVRFWLPYLWGLESAEYGVLLDLCESAADLHTVGDVRRLTVVEDELLNRPWRWAGGLTLKGYIDYLAGNHPRLGARTLDEMVGRIARVFWQTVERARAARTNQALNDPSEDHWLLYLYPWQAVTYAVEQVLSSP